MLSLKAVLAKVLSWIAKKPTNDIAYLTKYGNYWTGNVNTVALVRRGNVVQAQGYFALAAITGRQRFATIPEGYRPIRETYAMLNSLGGSYIIFKPNGEVTNDTTHVARNEYFSCTWLINDR